MENLQIYGFEMARIAEVYLSTLSAIMSPYKIERHFAALTYLYNHNGKITQNELAIGIKKDKVSTMRAVDYLCERGFVVRKKDKTDRRCHLLEVTPKALEIKPILKDAIQKTNAIMLAGISETNTKIFNDIMASLMQTIRALPEPNFIVEAYKLTEEK